MPPPAAWSPSVIPSVSDTLTISSVAPVLGYIGNRFQPPETQTPSAVPWAVRFATEFTDDINGTVSVAWANWYGDQVNTGSVMTLEAYLEYPVGVLTRMKFSTTPMQLTGTDVGVAAAGTNIWASAIVSGAHRGDPCWIRFYQQGTVSVYYCISSGIYAPLGDATIQNSTTLTGTMSGGSIGIRPAAMIGLTTRKNYAILGTSIEAGYGGAVSPRAGRIPSGIGGGIGYTNFGVSGSIATGWIANHTLRDELMQYAYGVINGYGTNDIFGDAVSAATLESRLSTIKDLYPSKPHWLATIDPRTTSSDSWATLGNQTVVSNTAACATFNANRRASPSSLGMAGLLDAALVSESGSTGKWVVTGAASYATSDGVHPSTAIYAAYSFPGFAGGLS